MYARITQDSVVAREQRRSAQDGGIDLGDVQSSRSLRAHRIGGLAGTETNHERARESGRCQCGQRAHEAHVMLVPALARCFEAIDDERTLVRWTYCRYPYRRICAFSDE